jgi:serine/threonine protein kinase
MDYELEHQQELIESTELIELAEPVEPVELVEAIGPVEPVELLEPLEPAELMPSDWIDNYQVLEKLAVGPLTTVYKVRREGIDEIFAAKVLRREFADNPRTAKRFIQEAQKAASLNNAHLVSVYEVGKTSSGEPFLICDFVEGGSLAERLAETGPLAQIAVLDLFLQVCEGLDQAHQKGVIHRDIKPAHIVFKKGAAAELVKLADFGIAKVLPSAGRETKYFTPLGEAFGNPTYMSPEQIQGARLDARSDIYALGCVMYECLCGEPPFTGPNSVRVALAQVQEDPKPLRLRALGVKLSQGMEVIVMRMIAKDQDDRYQSVLELIFDLKLVRAGGTPKASQRKVLPAKPLEKLSSEAEPQADERKSTKQVTAQMLLEHARARTGIQFDGKLASSAMEQSEHAQPRVAESISLTADQGTFAKFFLNVAASARKTVAAMASSCCIQGAFAKSFLNVDAFSLKTVVVAASSCGILFGIISAFFTMQLLSGGHSIEQHHAADYSAYQHPAYSGQVKQYYSLTAPSDSPTWSQWNLPNNQALRDTHNRVVLYYTHRHLREAVQTAVENHENLALAGLEGQNLSGLNLAGARLAGADLRGCDFTSANLVGADLVRADLTDAQMVNCDLRKARLGGANLTNARLNGANLRYADHKGADMTGTEVSPQMLDGTEPFYREPVATPESDRPPVK